MFGFLKYAKIKNHADPPKRNQIDPPYPKFCTISLPCMMKFFIVPNKFNTDTSLWQGKELINPILNKLSTIGLVNELPGNRESESGDDVDQKIESESKDKHYLKSILF